MNADAAIRRRYSRRMHVFMACYASATLAASLLLEKGKIASPALAWLLAALPGLAIVGVIYAMGRLLAEVTDEFQRMLMVRQALIATAFALGLGTIWGFLAKYGLVVSLETYWVAIFWLAGSFIGAIANRITYGTFGEHW